MAKKDVILRFSKIRCAKNFQLYFVIGSDQQENKLVWVELPSYYPHLAGHELTTITQRIITAIKNVFSKFKDENKDTLSYSVEFSDKFIAYGEFPILTARKWSDLKYPLTQQEIEIFFKALAEV